MVLLSLLLAWPISAHPERLHVAPLVAYLAVAVFGLGGLGLLVGSPRNTRLGNVVIMLIFADFAAVAGLLAATRDAENCRVSGGWLLSFLVPVRTQCRVGFGLAALMMGTMALVMLRRVIRGRVPQTTGVREG
ncbi:MAG: hypothetical protein ACYC3Q_00060 [Gemmatimonadaceae bacterium]